MDWMTGAEAWDAQVGIWGHGVASAYGWIFLGWIFGVAALLSVMVLLVVPSARRRFWCAGAGRQVEAVFEEFGLPGRRRPIAVLSCSAFAPPTALRCDHCCLDRRIGTRPC